MKRKQSEIEIRLRSTLPYVLLHKSNRNFYLSLYFIEENKMICKTSERTYSISKTNKNQKLEQLAISFITKAKPFLKEVIPNLRILKRKLTSKFTGISLLKILREKNFIINQNISNYDS